MKQIDVQSASIGEQNQLRQQQHEMNYAIDIQATSTRQPNLPCMDLLTGPKRDYLEIGVPLYEASLACDWRAARVILDKKPELVRYGITLIGETALHVASSAKGPIPRRVKEFVRNLVGRMEKDDLALETKDYNTALYLAAAAGNVKAVEIMVKENRTLPTIPGDGGQMLPLNAAALYGNYEVVKYLYNFSHKLRDDGWTHENRCWLLETCVENDMFDVALRIMEDHPALGRSGNVLGVFARKPKALCETSSNLIMILINTVLAGIDLEKVPSEKASDALKILRIILRDIADKPQDEIDNIFRGPPDANKKPVSDHVDQALKLQKLISEHIVNMHVEMQNIIKQDFKQASGRDDQALQLEKIISEHIANMQVKTQKIIKGPATKETDSSHVLFIAAETGNTKFVVELIRLYPELMRKVNDNNQTIFHIGVEHRHETIFNILYEIGSIKDSITSLVDENDNNMLHLVGKIAKKKRLREVSGVAFQMQLELLWFKEVERMVPPSYRKMTNKDGLTPYELFTKEHEDLLAQSEKWLTGMANQCMVVAALIATIAFAAAITVPGGYSQNNGIPIFYKSSAYTIFILADALSLISSSGSIVLFMSILTSRFAEGDFVNFLPRKLVLFLSTLFFSITTMIISFLASFFITYPKEMKWIPIVISVFSLFPVTLYINLQFGLLMDIIRSTYGSRHLFNPIKKILYNQNQKF